MPPPTDHTPEGELSSWNTPSTPKKEGEAFWTGSKKPKKAKQAGGPSKPPMAKWKKVTLWCGGSVGGLVLLILFLGPTVAGWIAPGFISGAAGDAIAGKVHVEGMSLSWFGSQTVGSIVVDDPAKSSGEVARLKVEASPGLFALALGAMGSGPDLGDIRLSGKVKIVRDVDGATNLDRALAPSKKAKKEKPASSSSSPAELPAGLKAHLIVTDLDVAYTDDTGSAAVGTVQIKDIRADATLVPADGSKGAEATLKFSARTASSQAGTPEGSLKIDAAIDSLTNTTGVVQIAKARIDATVRSEGLPVGVIDALAGMGGKLSAGLGPSLDVAMDAKGSLKNAEAGWKITSKNTSVTGAVTVTESLVVASSPIVVTANGQAVRALADLDKTLAATGTVAMAQVPDVTLSVDSLKFKIPASGDLDLRGGAAKVSLKTTEAKGTVKLLTEAGAKPDEFNVAPLNLSIDAPDLGGPVKVQGATVATLAGRPAGNLTIDLTAAGLLDARGEPRKGLPASVEGVVRLHNIASAIAQPFVQALKIDLAGDIGPTLNIDAKATTESAAAGVLPPVNIDLFVTGDKVDVKAGLTYADNMLRSRQQGVSVNLASAGAVASRFIDPATGWSLGKTGKLGFTVTDITVPLKDGSPALDKAQAKVELVLTGFSATPTAAKAAQGGAIDLTSVKIGAALVPGVPPKVTIDSSLAYQKQQFAVVGSLDVPGLYSVGAAGALAVTPLNARPVGTIELKNIPAVIAGVAAAEPKPAPPPAPGQPVPPPAPPTPELDLARVVSDAVGPTVGVTITSEASKTLAGGLDIGVAVRAERLTTDIKASVSTQQAALNAFTSTSLVGPATLDTLLATFAADLASRPRLAGVSKVVLRVDPLSIPLVQGADGSFTPDLARTGDATVHLELPDQTLVQNIIVKNEDGTTRDLGMLGVEAVDVKATVPLASALVPQERWLKPFNASVKARLLDAPSSRALAVTVAAEGQMTGEKGVATSVESARAKITVSDIVPQRLERFVGKPGMLTGSLGDSASIDANVVLRQVNPGTAQAGQTIDVDAMLKSPLVSMDQPLKIAVLPDRIKSDTPVQINWTMLPVFANAFVFVAPPTPPGKQPEPAPKLENPVNVTVTLKKFAIATGQQGGKAVGPLKPGIFDAALGATVPAFELLMPDGSKVKTTNFRSGVQTTAPLQATTPNPPSDIAFQMNIDEVVVALPGAAGPPPPAQRFSLTGTVSNLADEMGNVTADRAVVTATGDMPIIPTGLVDALAKQDGLLVDALGPVCSATLRADRFGSAGGTIDLTAKSARASANLKGNVEKKTFVSTEPIRVSLSEITNELAKRLVKGLPLIGTIQKTPQDEPAVFTATGMKVPLDNDLSRLNGDIVVDPGQAKFTTGDTFAGILGALHQKSMGNIGQKLDPLKVNIKNGVATYERWTFPLGEFKVETQGTVDLVKQTVDVLTYLPMGTLSDEAGKLFKSQPGPAAMGKDSPLTDKFLVPWRTRGTFGKTKTEPDFGLFARDLVKNIKPEDLVKKGLGDLLKPKEEPKK